MLLISGSPAPTSANSRLLLAIARLANRPATLADYLADLPVFQPARDKAPWPPTVLRLRRDLAVADCVIISTPAYLHNVPGVLKNTLDWLASSGEMAEKPTLVLTFTPGAPRGERARQSLLWSLEALNARVVAEAGLYQREVGLTGDGDIGDEESREVLAAALELLP